MKSLNGTNSNLGPAVRIKREWAKNAISKRKSSKAAGPSGIAEQMLKVYAETGIDIVMELANSIVSEAVVPLDWKSIFY